MLLDNMMQLHSTILFLLLVYSCTANKETVPVFLMDYDNVMSHLTLLPNPFVKMDATAFNDILTDAARRSDCVIIFTEDNLSTEDLSIKDNRDTAFYHLRKGLRERKVLYIPSVIDPYALLNGVFPPHASKVLSLGTGTKLKFLDSYKYIYVNFKSDPEMTRAATLRKHDILMREAYFTVRQLKPGPIVAFYTGKKNPIKLKSLEFNTLSPKSMARRDMGVMVVTDDALFCLRGVYASTPTRRSSFNQKPLVEDETRTRRTLSTTMQYSDFELKFNFKLGDKTWQLANVVLLEGGEEVGRTRLDIRAPWNSSYFCTEPMVVLNARDGSSVTVSRYQIQPIYRSSRYLRNVDPKTASKTLRSEDQGFGDIVNCSPYFNAHILMSLFVVLILSIILSIGVQALLNCKSNDRFDDPNQKPLQIAQEVG